MVMRGDRTRPQPKRTIIRAYLIIAVFAIVITAVILLNNWRSTEESFHSRALLLSRRQTSYFSQVLYTCRFIVDKGRTDKKYSDYYGDFDITSKLEIIEELGEMKKLSPFYEYIFFIDQQSDHIFGSNGEYDQKSFLRLFTAAGEEGGQEGRLDVPLRPERGDTEALDRSAGAIRSDDRTDPLLRQQYFQHR